MSGLSFHQQLFLTAFNSIVRSTSGMEAAGRAARNYNKPLEEVVAVTAFGLADGAFKEYQRATAPAASAPRPVVPQPAPNR